MRIISWNIRAGGGRRAGAIAEQLADWAPDIVVLAEFRGTPPGAVIADALCASGLTFQLSCVQPGEPARNAVFLASREPFRAVRLRARPIDPALWLVAKFERLTVAGMHIPNEVTKRKFPYMDAVAALAERWRRGPAVFVGDTNSGRPGIDEENPVFGPRYPAWFDRMERAGFRDAFRVLHPEAREFTWYSPNGGNGFRLDQAFVNRGLVRRVTAVSHAWAERDARRDALSDHAALIVDVR
jgi:exonuclease III